MRYSRAPFRRFPPQPPELVVGRLRPRHLEKREIAAFFGAFGWRRISPTSFSPNLNLATGSSRPLISRPLGTP